MKPFAKEKTKPGREAAESKGEGKTRRKGSPVGQTGQGGRGRSIGERKKRSFVSSLPTGLQKDGSLRCSTVGQSQET